MRKIFILLGTMGGVGYVPILPGTAGTGIGVIIYLIFSKISKVFPGPFLEPLIYLIILLVFIGAGVWISGRCNQYFKGNDNSSIVIDEVGGFLITMFALPFSMRFLLLGFILFRTFDIAKPFKIEKIQKLPGGWGIMADDIAAGILANLVLQASRMMLGW